VLDLGAGEGILTAELARRSQRVRAIEIDPALVARLRQRFAASANVEVVGGDALHVALPAEPFRVVANIPFNLTTAILRRLLDDPRVPLGRADVVVELEVAWKRARVTPSTALGVYWGAWYEFALLRRLDATAFAPPPGTDAGVLRIVRRDQPLVAPADAPAYRALVVAAF
jgi:23S rRNA (adenine-N6)-dimethyltransferase